MLQITVMWYKLQTPYNGILTKKNIILDCKYRKYIPQHVGQTSPNPQNDISAFCLYFSKLVCLSFYIQEDT